MAELPENNKTTISELLTAKLRALFIAVFTREKERLMIYVVAGVLLFIIYSFLRLAVNFSPTWDIVGLFLWILAVFLFRLPGRATITAGVISLMAIPLTLIVQKPLSVDPVATLTFFLLLLGVTQSGLEATHNDDPDENAHL